MPLTGDAAGLRRLRKHVASLASGEEGARVLRTLRSEVNTLLRDEFTKSTGPDGETWQKTVRGRPALLSRKLPFAFQSRVDRGELRYSAKTKRDLLTAHNEGHVFPARHVGAAKVVRDRKGRRLSANQFRRLLDRRLSAKRPRRKRAYTVGQVRAHIVRQRVLPQRRIVPGSELPTRWEAAFNAALLRAMASWADRAGR